MSVQLHPDIETLDKESLCYSIYAQLYHNFFNAQQKKDDEHPYGIEEGDETSLRLKNTAYGFCIRHCRSRYGRRRFRKRWLAVGLPEEIGR